MKKFVALLILLSVFAGRSDAVQINKKALRSIDDIVKEVTKGDLEIPKKSLLFVELHNLDYKYETGKKRKDPYSSVSSYLVPYIFTISSDASLAKTFKQPVIHTENSEDYLLLKHDSRRIFQTVLSAVSQNFNVMYQISSLTQNFLNGFYKIKSENNSISSTALTKKKDTSPAKKYANIFDMVSVPVKGYDNDVFAAVYTSESSDVARVILYEVDGDSWSVISELKTAPNNVELASLAVGDFDDDGFKNELALIVNSKTEIILYVYRFVYSGGKLQVKMLGSAEGYKILETGSNQAFAESAPLQAASQVLAGDYDGDGQAELLTNTFHMEPNTSPYRTDQLIWTMRMYEVQDGTVVLRAEKELCLPEFDGPMGKYGTTACCFSYETNGATRLALETYYGINEFTTTVNAYCYDGQGFIYLGGGGFQNYGQGDILVRSAEEESDKYGVANCSDWMAILNEGYSTWTTVANWDVEAHDWYEPNQEERRGFFDLYRGILSKLGISTGEDPRIMRASADDDWETQYNLRYQVNPEELYAATSAVQELWRISSYEPLGGVLELHREDPTGSLDPYRP